MPFYCFTTENGQTVERLIQGGCEDPSKIPEKVKAINDETGEWAWAYRDMAAEHGGRKATECTNWPKVCDASGFNEDQYEEVKADIEQSGMTGVEALPTGQMKYHSNKARRSYLHRAGLVDRSSFY